MNRTTVFRLFLVAAIVVLVADKVYQSRSHLVMIYHQKVRDPKTIREYLAAHSVRKLQLGAGDSHAEGWLNTEIDPRPGQIYLDATSSYPFPNGSFHYVFSEHLIEHLSWEDGLKMLKECHRILAPGGKIRMVTPNLTKLIYLLNGGTDDETREFIKAGRRLFGWPDTPIMPAYILNKVMHEYGHQFVYDPGTLAKTFEVAGFREIKEFRIGEKTDPNFEKVEYRTRSQGEDVWITNRWVAMAVEAVR